MPSILMVKRGTALLSVAAGDRQGLASPETLGAVDGCALLRTGRNGWIELTTWRCWSLRE